jgi:hypothetical protein
MNLASSTRPGASLRFLLPLGALLALAACGRSESPEDAANGIRTDAAAALTESDRVSNAAAVQAEAAREAGLRAADARGRDSAAAAIAGDNASEEQREENRSDDVTSNAAR